MDTPHVLLVIGSLHIGGAENVVANLARGLTATGCKVTICCTRFLGAVGEQLRREGFAVELIAPSRRLRHATSWMLVRAIRRVSPDIIHSHGTPAMIHLGPLGFLRLLPPWVHTFHYGNYDALNDLQTRVEAFFCSRATRLIAVSETQRRAIINRHGVRPDRITTLVNGVAPNRFVDDDAKRARIRTELGFAPADIVVASVAVLTKQKGISYLLDAARLVADRNPRVRFLIVGGGPLEQSLRLQASDLRLGGSVVFAGWREDAAAILPAAELFVMPSLWEAMPMVLLEAMSARRPIIVTDVGDNRRVVADGQCGVVIPPRDARAIADAVLQFASDSEGARRVGTAARQRFDREFTMDRMIERHRSLYQDVLGSGDGVRSTMSEVAES